MSMATRTILGLATIMLVTGCSSLRPGSRLSTTGRLITNVTVPYHTDFDNTPVGSRKCVIRNFKVQEPVSRYNVDAEWSLEKLKDAAMEAGITQIHHIDLHTFSILSGVIRQRDLIIYGD